MIGTVIGNYRILEQLGDGGMGTVYKAVDVNLDRTVALKALNIDFSGKPELEQRFRAEIKALGNLNHTNLATLYTLLVENGRPWMVSEFVEGETFAQIVARKGPIPSDEAIPLFQQALSGIGCAHRMGIIHRDIKPGNIMLDSHGVVKVMDVGVAKAMSARDAARAGTQMGTAFYMSPEQFLNRAVDSRSDIYSLGVTLYEMLTAKVPFSGDSDYQVMADHVNAPPPPLTQFFAYVPKSVESAVLKALEKNPDARYQSVEEFGAALGNTPDLAATVTDIRARSARGAAPKAAVAGVAAGAVAAHTGFFTRERKIMALGMVAILAMGAVLLAVRLGAKLPGLKMLAPSTSSSSPSAATGTATPPPTPPPDANAAAPNPAQPVAPADGGAVAVVPGQPVAPADGVAVGVVPVQPGAAADAAAPADAGAPAGPLVVPAGTVISVRLTDTVDSSMVQLGDKFGASVAAAVNVDGTEAIPAGSDASLALINLAQVPVAKQTDVQLQLVSLNINGTDYNARTSIFERQSAVREKKKVIGGAVVGAAIGGIFGHGKGAADGAAAGAGKAFVVIIPAQTRIKFTLRRSITLQ